MYKLHQSAWFKI